MSSKILRSAIAIARKEILSEFRMRYMLSSALLFILTVISIIAFSMRNIDPNSGLHSALLWIVFFFISMTGLARSFIAEEERKTLYLLKLIAPSHSVYVGKLLYNILLSFSLNSVASVLFFVFAGMPETISFSGYTISLLFGSIGLASSVTIISSLISRSGAKNALLPALSFPIVLPLVLTGIQATGEAIAGVSIDQNFDKSLLMMSYSGVLITASYLLFEHVWLD